MSTFLPTTPTPVLDRPAAGRWVLDPGHTEVGFVGRHFGLTRIRGRFTGVTGALIVAEDLAGSELAVTIDMGSVTSGDRTRDDHLRSPDLFDADRYPTASFVSTSVLARGRTATVTGDLTMKDVTRQVDLDVEYLGSTRDPWGADRAVFTASTVINREDWGISWNMVLEAGGLLVSKEIRLEIEAELLRQDG
jgi:polyisoprenoid-binding protein YceI